MEESKDKKYNETLLFLLNNVWSGNDILAFPAPNSVNIENKYFTKLKNFKYKLFINNPTINTRALLFLFVDAQGNNRAVLISKDFKIHLIDIDVMQNYYNYTIFDVLVNYDLGNISIIDTYISCGQKVNKISHSERISESELFLANVYKINPDINIKVKEFYIDKTQFKNSVFDKDEEEIYIIPENFPLLTGTNFSSFKWRPPDKLVFNFLTEEKEDYINLYCTQFKTKKLFATITEETDYSKELINKIKSLENYKNLSIIQYNICLENKTLFPVKTPDNINIPSSVRSIETILLCKKENIKLENILFNIN